MPEEPVYRIGEVAALLGLRTSVLRFWESEFSELMPQRTQSGHRLYGEADVAVLRRIKQLLHEQGMTIDGARRVLQGGLASPSPVEAVDAYAKDRDLLRDICRELSGIRDMLASGGQSS